MIPRQLHEVFVLVGNYGLLERLGQGAFGVVHRGWDIRNRRDVAIKRPLDHLDDMQRRLLAQFYSEELRVTAQLHLAKNVIHVLDFNVSYPFLVTEYCDGGSLRRRLRDPYNIAEIISWTQSVATLLSSAHYLEPDVIIHRDLKPENILLKNGEIRVADFGGAMTIPPSSNSLRTLLPYGFTLGYAAPEAIEALKGTTKVHNPPALDIWSLGIILYELLTGHRPFEEPDLEDKIQMHELPDQIGIKPELRSSADAALSRLTLSCLSKLAANRPSAKQCARILAEVKGS
jgi:serine/threonine protein kinase